MNPQKGNRKPKLLHDQTKGVESAQKPRLIAVIVIALGASTFIAYSEAPRCGFILVDDEEYVQKNPAVLQGLSFSSIAWAFTHRHQAMYHPLTTISHMADVEMFGLEPGGHHLVNVVLHAANGCLLLIALVRLTNQLWPSAFVAAVFALHPQHVESVAWISERKDVLSGFFFMLCLLAYTAYARRPSVRRYVVLAVLFALGLLCKPMLVTLPIILLLLDFWPLQRTNVRRLIIEKLPLAAIAAIFSIIALKMQQSYGAVVLTMPLGTRLANAVLSYTRYVGLTFWPYPLSFFYPHPFPNAWPAALVVIAAIALIGFSLVTIAYTLRRRSLLVGWAWFVIMLLPVIGIVQIGTQAMADRYSYLPSIGLTIGFTWLLIELIPFARFKLYAALGAAGILALCLLRTVAQVEDWRDQELLYRVSLDAVHESSFLRNVLSWTLFLKDRPDEAIENYRLALEYDPNNAIAESRLGTVLLSEGKVQEAHEHLARALAIKPRDGFTLLVLANVYHAEGNMPAALDAARKACEIDPSNRDAQAIVQRLMQESGSRQ